MNDFFKYQYISLIIIILFLSIIHTIFCQIKIDLPNSQTYNFFIFAVTESQLYVSNFDFNVIYNLDIKKRIGVFLPGNKIHFTGKTPLFFKTNNKYTHIFNHYDPDIYVKNLSKNIVIKVPIYPYVKTAYKSLKQWDENSALVALCDRKNIYNNEGFMHLYLVSIEGYIKLHQVSSVTTICSWSIDIVKIDSSTVMTMNYMYNYNRSRFMFWKIDNSEITMISYYDSDLMKGTDAGHCRYVRIKESTITECCCINLCQAFACQQLDLYPNEHLHPYSGIIMNGCTNENYSGKFAMYILAEDFIIIGCVGETKSFRIQVYKLSYNGLTAIHYSLYVPLDFEKENFEYSEMAVTSSYKIVLIQNKKSSNTEYEFYSQSISFCFNEKGADVDEGDKHYSYYLKSTENKYYLCSIDKCKVCLEINSVPRCEKCLKGYYLYVDIENKCTKLEEQTSEYILDPILLKYQTCSDNYYIENNQFYCSQCTAKYPYLIESERRCVEDCKLYGLLLYTDKCVQSCPDNTYLISKRECVIYQTDTKAPVKISNNKEEVFESLEDNIDYLISMDISTIIGSDYIMDVYPYSLKDIVEENSLTAIDLGESILNTLFGIDDTEIYIAKIEYIPESSIIPYVQYNIYDKDGNLLDLSVIEDIGISVSYSILDLEKANFTFYQDIMKQTGADIYNINDRFFNDICYPYAYNKTDVTLDDRKSDFYLDVQLCQDGCTYEGIDSDSKRSICRCKIVVDEIEVNNSTFLSKIYYNTNLPLFKCYSLVFNWNNLKISAGFYFYLTLCCIEILCLLIFLLTSPFRKILEYKFKEYCDEMSEKDEKSEKQSSINQMECSSDIFHQKGSPQRPLNEKIKKHQNNKDNLIIYTEDLNILVFKQAKQKDKRNLIKFLGEIVLMKIDILSLVCESNIFVIFLLNFSIFILSLGTDFFMNALLFADDMISERYQRGGDLSYWSTLFLTILSNICSFIVVFFITKLSNFSGLDLIKEQATSGTHFLKLFGKSIFIVKLKLYIYFCVVFILIPFYLYFTCAFCAVYHLSQMNWISNSFLSIGLSILYSIGSSIIVTFFRYIGLYFKSETTYNVSLYINRS